jgi:hypothetical protein
MNRGWSKKSSNCLVCHTTERKHKGNGLCRRCYARRFNQKPDVKARAIVRANRHYERIKETEKYKEWVRKRSKRMQLIHQVQRMAKREFFHTGRGLTRERGAKYRCQVCHHHVITLPKDIKLFSLFVREINKLCRRFGPQD